VLFTNVTSIAITLKTVVATARIAVMNGGCRTGSCWCIAPPLHDEQGEARADDHDGHAEPDELAESASAGVAVVHGCSSLG
jgi:hypothetical protein